MATDEDNVQVYWFKTEIIPFPLFPFFQFPLYYSSWDFLLFYINISKIIHYISTFSSIVQLFTFLSSLL